MTQKNLVLIESNGSTQLYGHPETLAKTVKVKRSLSTKATSTGVKVTNNRVEVVINADVPVTVCGDSCAGGSEVLSVRLSTSGTPKNSAELDAMLDTLKSIIDKAKASRLTSGYPMTQDLVWVDVDEA